MLRGEELAFAHTGQEGFTQLPRDHRILQDLCVPTHMSVILFVHIGVQEIETETGPSNPGPHLLSHYPHL